MKIILVILGMALVTYLPRLLPAIFLDRFQFHSYCLGRFHPPVLTHNMRTVTIETLKWATLFYHDIGCSPVFGVSLIIE